MEHLDYTPLYLGLAGFIVSALGVIANFIINRRKVRSEEESLTADAAGGIVSAATKLIEPLQCEIKRLQDRVAGLEAEAERDREEYIRIIKDLMNGVKILIQQVVDQGGQPRYLMPSIPVRILQAIRKMT